MIYDILEKVANKNKGDSLSEISDKIYNIQNERAAALIEELKVKKAEIEALKLENKKLLKSTVLPAPSEIQKPLSAQQVYEKFQMGKGSDIIAKLETELKK